MHRTSVNFVAQRCGRQVKQIDRAKMSAVLDDRTNVENETGVKAKISRPSPSTDSLRFVKMSEHAVMPTRGSVQSAGADLYSAHDYTVPARGKALCKTDLQVAVPLGTYGRVAPRSGLALKHSIDVGAGVIDADYRGGLGVILFNLGDQDYNVKRGDRIAQLICERIVIPTMHLVDSLEQTERGEGGFGSTGVN